MLVKRHPERCTALGCYGCTQFADAFGGGWRCANCKTFYPEPAPTVTIHRASNDCGGLPHFFHGGTCVNCGTLLACCRNCRSSYDGGDRGAIACGHGVDDEALQSGETGKNPIWAERKYSYDGIVHAMQHGGEFPEGSDCDRLSPDDGRTCATFEPKEGL